VLYNLQLGAADDGIKSGPRIVSHLAKLPAIFGASLRRKKVENNGGAVRFSAEHFPAK